jgi:hypothetical protein
MDSKVVHKTREEVEQAIINMKEEENKPKKKNKNY